MTHIHRFKLLLLLFLLVGMVYGSATARADGELPLYVVNKSDSDVRLRVFSHWPYAFAPNPSCDKRIPAGRQGFLTNDGEKIRVGPTDGFSLGDGRVITAWPSGGGISTFGSSSRVRTVDGEECWVVIISGSL